MVRISLNIWDLLLIVSFIVELGSWMTSGMSWIHRFYLLYKVKNSIKRQLPAHWKLKVMPMISFRRTGKNKYHIDFDLISALPIRDLYDRDHSIDDMGNNSDDVVFEHLTKIPIHDHIICDRLGNFTMLSTLHEINKEDDILIAFGGSRVEAKIKQIKRGSSLDKLGI